MAIVEFWTPVIVSAISAGLLVRLQPHRPRPAPGLRAGVIEYILVAVVVIGTIGVGLQVFGDEAEKAFKSLGTWVSDSTQNLK